MIPTLLSTEVGISDIFFQYEMSFSLASIDIYCLEQILAKEGVSKILIYQCGDLNLNRKLLQATREIRLSSSHKYETLKLPLVISQFNHLHSLEIQQNAEFVDKEEWSIKFLALPKTLTSLVYNIDLENTGFLPSLTNLYNLVMSRTIVSPSHVNNFPPSLVCIGLLNLAPDFRAFPPNIKSVKFFDWEQPTATTVALLEGITDLCYNSVPGGENEGEDPLITQLPKTVERVHDERAFITLPVELPEYNNILRLYNHPNQNCMITDVTSYTTTVFNRLPAHVTELRLYSSVYGHTVTMENAPVFDLRSLSNIKMLSILSTMEVIYPANLTFLEIDDRRLRSLHWPPNLLELICTISKPLKEIPTFPLTLTSLDLQVFTDMEDPSVCGKLPFCSLPPGLVSLYLRLYNSPPTMSQLTPLLPTSLKILDVEVASEDSPSYFSNLPPNLTHFLLKVPKMAVKPIITTTDTLLLPQSLKLLETVDFHCEPDVLLALPPRLESLAVSIKSNNDGPSLNAKHMNALPKTITSLTLQDLLGSRYNECWDSPTYCFEIISRLPINCPFYAENMVAELVYALYAEKKIQHMMSGKSFSGLMTNADVYSYTDNDVNVIPIIGRRTIL